MAQHNKTCQFCGELGHSKFYCKKRPNKPISTSVEYGIKPSKPRKAIRKVSDKQQVYLDWLEEVARPFLIERDGNFCCCCGRPAYDDEKLDIEHTKGKGSHPDLKKELTNLTLMCRFPCHRNKTDGKECNHGFKVLA